MVLTSLWQRTESVEAKAARFENCMAQSYRQVFNLAVRLTETHAEAEDLVQEAYLRAFRFFDKYDRGLSFTNWMYRIVGNTHIDLIRRHKKLKTARLDGGGENGIGTWDIADGTRNAEEAMSFELVDGELEEGLNTLSAEFRMSVVLADVMGFAYEEVAEIMETSVGTVRSRLHRGRKQLRTFLLKSAPDKYGRYVNELQ